MVVGDSYIILMSLYSFVCFHVTADLNLEGSFKAVTDKKRMQLELDRQQNFNSIKTKRAFQTPVLSGPATPLTEDWNLDSTWPQASTEQLGQVGGVSINSRGEVVVFHRGKHVWGANSFDWLNQFQEKDRGPISSPTILVYHPQTGSLLNKWGENMFYLPHGVTVDHEDNLWLTDVALHQVFKFPPLEKNERSPLLALGKPFVPGNSAVRFCKPTSVAVTTWGDFFVADGYCNSRLVKFNKSGVKIMEIGHATFNFGGLAGPDPYSFAVPHALTLAEDRKLVCVADRENGRVLCFDWNNGTFVFHISSPQIGPLIYSIAYTPLQGGLFFVVNGESRLQFNAVPTRGYVLSASNLRTISYFGTGLQKPHDIAVSPDGMFVFVGEIGPNLINKYTHNGTLGPAGEKATTSSPKVITPQELIVPVSPQSLGLSSPQGTVLPAVLVTCAAVLFGAAILTAALVYSRARRRGCGHCGGRRWMLGRSPAEGFMIGHLLGQHSGFEKLSTAEESEEEITALQPFA